MKAWLVIMFVSLTGGETTAQRVAYDDIKECDSYAYSINMRARFMRTKGADHTIIAVCVPKGRQ
jgi:hypothetical protein